MAGLAGILAATAADTSSAPAPRLVIVGEASPALQEVADETWDRFLLFLTERRPCIADVVLRRVWELDDRARYLPEERVILLRVPASPAQIEETLVHEFAHHLELTCPEHTALRPAFARAQGFPPGTDWFGGDEWELRPSEHFAETVVELVSGSGRYHRLAIPVSEEAKDVVARWATHPASP